MKRTWSAFTLIELLVVINNLKQLALGCHNYHDVNKFLPPSRIARDAYVTWTVLIMPYIEQTAAYNMWNIKLGMSQQSTAALQVQLPIMFCPSRRGPMLAQAKQDDFKLKPIKTIGSSGS